MAENQYLWYVRYVNKLKAEKVNRISTDLDDINSKISSLILKTSQNFGDVDDELSFFLSHQSKLDYIHSEFEQLIINSACLMNDSTNFHGLTGFDNPCLWYVKYLENFKKVKWESISTDLKRISATIKSLDNKNTASRDDINVEFTKYENILGYVSCEFENFINQSLLMVDDYDIELVQKSNVYNTTSRQHRQTDEHEKRIAEHQPTSSQKESLDNEKEKSLSKQNIMMKEKIKELTLNLNSSQKNEKHLTDQVNRLHVQMAQLVNKRCSGNNAKQCLQAAEHKIKELQFHLSEKNDLNNALREEISELKLNLNKSRENEKYLTNQFSKQLSSQEYDRTDAHENLNDVSKPSSIVNRSKDLYRETYSNAWDQLHSNGHSDEMIQTTLVKIYMMTYNLAGRKVEELKKDLFKSLKEILNQFPLANADHDLPKHLQVEVCALLRNNPDQSCKEEVVQKISESCRDISAPWSKEPKSNLNIYIKECVDVTWLMNACVPPMILSIEGEIFESNKHTRSEGVGPYIERFIWPCIYFSKEEFEKANVFARGDVIRTNTRKTAK